MRLAAEAEEFEDDTRSGGGGKAGRLVACKQLIRNMGKCLLLPFRHLHKVIRRRRTR